MSTDKYSYMLVHTKAHTPSGKDPNTQRHPKKHNRILLAVIFLLTLGRRVDERRGQRAGSMRLSLKGSLGF